MDIKTKLKHCVGGNFEHELPVGFVDDSYGNDVCASILSKELKLKIFIDDVNHENREITDSNRFTMLQTNEDGEVLYDFDEGFCFETDSWDEILKAINSIDELQNYLKEQNSFTI